MQNTTTSPQTNTNRTIMDGYFDSDQALREAEEQAIKEEIEEMKEWAKGTKINAPIPRDLLPLLTKDPAKQIELAMDHMDLGKEK